MLMAGWCVLIEWDALQRSLVSFVCSATTLPHAVPISITAQPAKSTERDNRGGDGFIEAGLAQPDADSNPSGTAGLAWGRSVWTLSVE